MESGQQANQVNEDAALTIIREFKAPRDLVFSAFSEAGHLAQWWGPAGYQLSVLHLDFRPGGIFHYKMESGERTMYARFVYGKIDRPELLEFTISFTDENGSVIRAPFFDNWPLEVFNRLTFSEQGGTTTITMQSYPVNAGKEEIGTYIRERNSFRGGTNATFDQLELLLSRL